MAEVYNCNGELLEGFSGKSPVLYIKKGENCLALVSPVPFQHAVLPTYLLPMITNSVQNAADQKRLQPINVDNQEVELIFELVKKGPSDKLNKAVSKLNKLIKSQAQAN